MAHSELLEVTITHNLENATEVDELFSRQWIALDWYRKGSDPKAYEGRAKIDVTLFNTMQQNGAAVIAAYKKATPAKPSSRLVGLVEAGVKFESLNGLLCLPLSSVRDVDSSRSFLGNLAPRQCTIQRCGKRAKGRLADLVCGRIPDPTVEQLHHHDVEWLVTNYLLVTGLCECVWSGGRSYPDIDHAGWMPGGRELLAQTTVSANLVRKKAKLLLNLASGDRELYLFAPEASESQCLEGITYCPIEKLIPELRQKEGGNWLIQRMFAMAADFGDGAK